MVDAMVKGGALHFKRISVSVFAPIPFICFSILFGADAVFPSILAAVLHECGHLVAILLCGMGVKEMRICPFGGEIVTKREAPDYPSGIAVALAGIAVNLLLACFFFLPHPSVFTVRLAGSSLMLALFNLLPIKTLDGGAALLAGLRMLVPLSADAVMKVFSRVFLTLLVCFGLATVFFSGFNPTLLLLSTYLFLDLF